MPYTLPCAIPWEEIADQQHENPTTVPHTAARFARWDYSLFTHYGNPIRLRGCSINLSYSTYTLRWHWQKQQPNEFPTFFPSIAWFFVSCFLAILVHRTTDFLTWCPLLFNIRHKRPFTYITTSSLHFQTE